MCAENDSGQPGCAKNGACNSFLTQFASGDGSWQCYQVPSFLKSLVLSEFSQSLQIDPLPDSELPRRRHVPGAEAPVSRRAAMPGLKSGPISEARAGGAREVRGLSQRQGRAVGGRSGPISNAKASAGGRGGSISEQDRDSERPFWCDRMPLLRGEAYCAL